MPRPYQPPVTRREQAIRSAGVRAWFRGRWLGVLLLGLLPLAAAALASELSAPGRSATAPVAAPAVAPTVAPTALPTVEPTVATTAEPTIAPTAAPTLAAATAPAIVPTAAPTDAATPASTEAATAGATTTTVAAPSGGPYRAYSVQPGDNLHAIASQYGVSVTSIAQASGLQNPDRLSVGQVLTIPNQDGTLYRVQPGETLEDIAARTGISGSSIAAASELSTAGVSPGQVILIPSGSSARSK
jgi:LysM repeat protein